MGSVNLIPTGRRRTLRLSCAGRRVAQRRWKNETGRPFDCRLDRRWAFVPPVGMTDRTDGNIFTTDTGADLADFIKVAFGLDGFGLPDPLLAKFFFLDFIHVMRSDSTATHQAVKTKKPIQK